MTILPPREHRRADAVRSRTRILAAAAAAFSRSDSPTFKDIASDAGVGIGTLFRHFPTREALVEAVFLHELTRLCDSAEDLIAQLPANEALRRWMGRWSDFVATKRGMADVLQALNGAGAVTKSETGARLTAAIRGILEAGGAAGTLRTDVRPEDVTAALAGTLLVAGTAEQQDQADRLLDLLMDGLTAPPRRAAPHANAGE